MSAEPPFWREALAPYARPHLGRSMLGIGTSLVPYLVLLVLMYLALDISYLLALALAIPAAGFQVRTFIAFHDCAHGSFLPSKRANAWLGAALGLIVYTPFASWRHSHAIHHASSGDLDRRGTGDVQTLTVAEYRAAPWRARLGVPPVPQPAGDVRAGADLRDGPAAAPRPPLGAPADPAQRDRDGHRARGGLGRALLARRVARGPARAGARDRCSRARRASGSSTSSTSSRTPTGRAAASGATPRRRSRAAAT